MTIAQPHLLRLKASLHYLSMSKQTFNQRVRPYISSVRIGQRGVAFDREELDTWIAQHKKITQPLATTCRRSNNQLKTGQIKRQLGSGYSNKRSFEQVLKKTLAK